MRVLNKVVLGPILVTLCGTAAAQSLGESLRQALTTHVNAAAGLPASASANASEVGGKRLKDTSLAKIFEKYPAAQSNPEFPKIALSFAYPAWIDAPDAAIGKMKRNQCLQYSAVLWSDARTSQRFDGLQVCPDEFARVSHDSLRAIWPSFSIPQETTGQVRTEGPIPPKFPFPTDERSKKWMMFGGVWYLGAVMTGLGYDWNYSEDKRRVWVAKVGDLKASDLPVTSGSVAVDNAPSAGEGISSGACKSSNFNMAAYNAIQPGMSLNEVNKLMGCAPDPEFTQRSPKMVMYMWQVAERGRVAAKQVQVFFDATGAKALTGLPGFKTAQGF